ncbi:uncharacterized protein [Epargyreus clarus]|uniref:uncharacterized protein n=1 Tax=Epargyreus clarus TaxID=520877 RepID=UPI003C2AAE3C
MFRTPKKQVSPTKDSTQNQAEPEQLERSPQKILETQASKVRRSIGEWETGKTQQGPSVGTETIDPAEQPALKTSTFRQSTTLKEPKATHQNRVLEARACLNKAKLLLGQSRNIKTEIKADVIKAVERLYQLVKEGSGKNAASEERPEAVAVVETTVGGQDLEGKIERRLEEMHTLLKGNTAMVEEIQRDMRKQSEDIGTLTSNTKTYANAVAGYTKSVTPERSTALHSVLISSEIETDSGEEVLNKVRANIKAKEKGIRIDRIKKAKDSKVIISCSTEAERQKIAEGLKNAGGHLKVTEIKNRDPLLLLRNVLNYNSDDDLRNALRQQNGNLFKDLDEAEVRVEPRYRKKTRNPHTCHVVIRVSPKIWRRALDAGVVYVDLQKIRVEDQSPLVQCSQCLGYGHSRRFCTEPVERCSHCGGPHLRPECTDLVTGAEPTCCNCTKAKMENAAHNAFSSECPVRRKWDALARATVAYC